MSEEGSIQRVVVTFAATSEVFRDFGSLEQS